MIRAPWSPWWSASHSPTPTKRLSSAGGSVYRQEGAPPFSDTGCCHHDLSPHWVSFLKVENSIYVKTKEKQERGHFPSHSATTLKQEQFICMCLPSSVYTHCFLILLRLQEAGTVSFLLYIWAPGSGLVTQA